MKHRCSAGLAILERQASPVTFVVPSEAVLVREPGGGHCRYAGLGPCDLCGLQRGSDDEKLTTLSADDLLRRSQGCGLAGALGALTASLLGMSVGGAALVATLYASASYIAAPAAMRIAVPEANAALSITAPGTPSLKTR